MLRRGRVLLLFAGLLAARPASAHRAAFFVFDYPPGPDTFTIRLVDSARIAEARRILRGDETLAIHVMGKVRRRRARWNRPWHVILAPRSIRFFEVAVEVCDAAIAAVEQHRSGIGGAYLPGRTWCPWGSRLLREVTP
jgi:hypothetical protein